MKKIITTLILSIVMSVYGFAYPSGTTMAGNMTSNAPPANVLKAVVASAPTNGHDVTSPIPATNYISFSGSNLFSGISTRYANTTTALPTMQFGNMTANSFTNTTITGATLIFPRLGTTNAFNYLTVRSVNFANGATATGTLTTRTATAVYNNEWTGPMARAVTMNSFTNVAAATNYRMDNKARGYGLLPKRYTMDKKDEVITDNRMTPSPFG